MGADRFKLITVESDFGAGKKGAALGPQALINELRNKKFNAIDGVRVEEPLGWWLVRASNTQSALIIRAEGNTEAGLCRVR